MHERRCTRRSRGRGEDESAGPASAVVRVAGCSMKSFARVVQILLVVFAVGSLAAAADERPGSLGFSLAIDGDGFLDPTLRSVTVTDVVASSPAAAAGIAPNDRIVEVEGRPIAGTRAGELKPYLKRNAGQAVRLRLRRPGGVEYDVTLIAAPKG